MEKQSSCEKASWIRGKFLGKGAFGTVSLAINESDGTVFAVKSVDLSTCLPGQLECLENEIRILRSLSSPYVVDFLGDDVTTSHRNLHVEYMSGGTLVDVAVVKQRSADLDERILRWHTRCLLLALKYVHDQGIIHCDVKGKNVLVGLDFTTVKLADFGSAIVKECAADKDRSTMITPRGSPLWMAPEVILGEYQGLESDVWSLGCTVIEMLTGNPAWEDQGFSSLARIANSDELPRLPPLLSELGEDFVDKCLRRDLKQRWSCDQLLQHPFVRSASAPIGEPSPRCVLDFSRSEFKEDESTGNLEGSVRERIGKLATEGVVYWESDGWVAVRSYARESGGTKEETECTGSGGIIRRRIEGTNSETADCCHGSNSAQCSNYEVTKRLKWSSGRICTNIGLQKGELRIYISYNLLLLQLFFRNLRKLGYVLLVSFNYSFIYYIIFLFPLGLNFALRYPISNFIPSFPPRSESSSINLK
ncbi:Clathrin, heavy chain isoform 1 [Hibiscus syriacus]|uniref:Clathrin, heavy chain isoform 1 n=1 Tax=Hibiscus syriacus TaxID=106335 RepID=A0A6A2ZAM1_HIBSY|nr:mitogen-activated protein kinase kinase kinase 18-like [Hibiscus syriacus]KAE8688520.1 Clathrin, heavy chain isoform 1 [Hibiscus syriacus]